MEAHAPKRARSVVVDNNNEREELAGENDENEIRRELRLKYRKVIDSQEERASQRDVSEITREIIQVNTLFSQVTHPREAALDAEYFKNVSTESEQKVSKLPIGLRERKSPEELTVKLRKYLGFHEEDFGTVVDTSTLWEEFGKKAMGYFHRAPSISILGFNSSSDFILKAPRARKEKQQLGRKVTTETVGEGDEGGNKNDKETTRKILALKTNLKRKNEVDFLELVTDKASFSKTIENMFCLTFLVRDGHAQILNKGTRTTFDFIVKYRNQPSPQEKEQGLAPSWQFIWSMDYELWKKAVKYLDNRVRPVEDELDLNADDDGDNNNSN